MLKGFLSRLEHRFDADDLQKDYIFPTRFYQTNNYLQILRS